MCLHTTVTWRKVCGFRKHPGAKKKCNRIRTSLTFCASPPGYVFTRRMRTFAPLNVPSYTDPSSESERVHDFGSTPLTPHIFLSSSSGSRDRAMSESEMLQRIYINAERGEERNGLKTHFIQVINEPGQILALQAWKNVLILVSVEEVCELLVKPGRSSVEVAELL